KKLIGITVVLLFIGTGISSVIADNPEILADEVPPVITNALVTPTTQTRVGTVNITCEVTDDIAVNLVKVNITYPDATTQNFSMIYDNKTYMAYLNQSYDQIGDYYLFIWANDTSGNQNQSNQLHFKIINQQPNIPSNPSPPDGATDISTTAILSWDGGDPDGDACEYDVFFGINNPPGQVTNNQPEVTYDPDLSPSTTYFWYIISSDGNGGSATGEVWSFTTSSGGSGNVSCEITNPGEPGIYIGGQKRINLPGTVFVYGSITITVMANATSGIMKVEFYIGSTLKATDSQAPYEYTWRKLISGRNIIKVIAYDNDNNTAEDTIQVFKWRIHPALILAGTYGSFKAVQRVLQGKPIIGWTIIRGVVLNVKEQGNDIIFRAVRLHFTEITGTKSSTGVIRGKRVQISDVGLNRMLTIGPFGSLSYVFAISYGELKELN
ncbi:MAG: hypothetical protein KKC68_02515, partial [Candidatus Thermoplasmatota archaeon]|nr:hypothetical protein [Candidatus Thermoplasmatota archaeon]MBU1940625.1 hypothetical protein [Candidatus Thermoplasmatota archaeon]